MFTLFLELTMIFETRLSEADLEAFFTVTLQDAFFLLPSLAVAVIVTVPALIPFTVPVLLFTVAIFVLLLLYVTEDTPASVALTVAVFPL